MIKTISASELRAIMQKVAARAATDSDARRAIHTELNALGK